MPFHYFAYGSNMFTKKMRLPAPSATFVAIGRILGYVLRLAKKSDDGSGKGNIVETRNPADEVRGVIFEISDAERTALDKSEGGYDPADIDVLTETETVRSVTYIAKPCLRLRGKSCVRRWGLEGRGKGAHAVGERG